MRPMFLLGLSVLAVGLVVGLFIGINSSESLPDGLEGTWVLRYYGKPWWKLRVPYPWSDITLTISAYATAEQKIGGYPARENVIAGSAGVNWYFGNYEVDGNKFTTYTVHGEEKHTGGLICTEAAGPSHLMAQEDRYLDILTSAQTYEITNGRLIISSGEELLGFKRKR
jgi:hypothetical protein